ncbi:MAG: YihY/virulence factor BrkB family protein [Planctomycetes bacterium]|nr:YihY/virulence factor BrkB family protein [Planctomycetota bacterium]
MSVRTQGKSLFQILKQTVKEFIADGCMSHAAALAYYTIFSLPALRVIVVAIAGLAFDPADVRGRVASEIRTVVGEDGARQVRTMIGHAEELGSGWFVTIIGIGVLLFGATGALAQLQAALNSAWGVRPDPQQGGLKNFLTKRILSLAMVLVVGFVLLVSLIAAAGISAVSHRVLPEAWSRAVLHWTNFGISFATLTLLFAAIFKVLPDAKIAWRHVWVGAAVTSLLFTVGKVALGFYFGNADVGSAYGTAGSLALILVWIYYSSVILLLGAEFTQVWAQRHGEGIRPAHGAVRILQKCVEMRDGDGTEQRKHVEGRPITGR